jgi:hypothetical protein
MAIGERPLLLAQAAYIKAKKNFEINQAQIWLLLEQITRNPAF